MAPPTKTVTIRNNSSNVLAFDLPEIPRSDDTAGSPAVSVIFGADIDAYDAKAVQPTQTMPRADYEVLCNRSPAFVGYLQKDSHAPGTAVLEER